MGGEGVGVHLKKSAACVRIKVPSVRIGRRACVSVQDGYFKVRRGARKKAVLGLLFRNFTKRGARQ